MMLGVSSLIGIIANPLGGELASRYGEKRWFVMTLFGSYAFFALAFLVRGYWFFMIAYIIHSFFGTLGMPAHMTLIARLSPPHQKGVGFALSSIPYNIVMPVSAMVAAYIADTYGLYPIFVITTVIYFIGLVILHLGVKVED
jgi:DHA1 family multidrug resistance protein-like MFS transporter